MIIAGMLSASIPCSHRTMKVKIVSDQHLEFRASNGSYRKYFNAIHPTVGEMADVCVVAGDFDVIGPRSQAFFQELCNREQQVLYVPGNHEYYGCTSMESVDDTLREFEQGLTNLVVLRTGATFEFAGTRFLGDTMWVPKTPDLIMSAGLINDARLIPRLLGQIEERHHNFIGWLSGELRPEDIVVTHHLPSERSTPTAYRDSAAQPWFVAAGVEALYDRGPRAWIHGHTHERCDYVLNQTQVVCNPVGYPDEAGKLPGRLAPCVFTV